VRIDCTSLKDKAQKEDSFIEDVSRVLFVDNHSTGTITVSKLRQEDFFVVYTLQMMEIKKKKRKKMMRKRRKMKRRLR